MNAAKYYKFRKYLIIFLSVLTGLLHIGKFTIINMESIKFYIWHLTLGLIFVFLYTPLTGKKEKASDAAELEEAKNINAKSGKKNEDDTLNLGLLLIDWVLILATTLTGIYLIATYNEYVILMQSGTYTPILYILGMLMTLLVFEASRRTIGWALPIIGTITILYALLGSNLPGLLGHRGYNINRIAATLLSDQGFFGTPIAVSANTVFLFLLFGAFLNVSGADKIFQDISIMIAGRLRGGPAKMAVVASCLFGSISGSAVANVVSTGAFTIPLMKKQGYSRRFSGAVEAVASTGGQIMPPVMGAAAFVLADISQTPYATVCISALLPALMYYLTLFKMVDLESVKNNLGSVPEDEIPKFKDAMGKGFKLIIPLFILLFFLLVMQETPMKSAIYSIIAIMIAGQFDKEDRFDFKKLIDSFVDGSKSLPQVVAACACSGVVTGMFALTGLGLKFSDFVITLGGTHIMLSLFLSMLICVILGMGLPTTASYIIGATAIAPALIKIGVPALPAHLFILYFASISAITPPVAVASYAAASLADENPMKVGLTAVKLGLSGFVLPFIFVINTDYLHFGFNYLTLSTWVSAIVVCYSAAIVVMGYVEQKITVIERALYFIVIILAIQTNYITSVAGWILFAIMYFGRKAQAKKALLKV